jgi:hypothetical protein
MKSYLLRVVVEPDEDVWRAYVPELEARAGAGGKGGRHLGPHAG